MIPYFSEMIQNFTPVTQALITGAFAWILGAFGAAFVFLRKDFDQRVFDLMLGFAGGIMISASFWSLLHPAVDMADTWAPAVVGFLLGSLLMILIDRVLPHLHIGYPTEEAEGVKTSWQRSVLLVLAITLHNIPEGFAIGVAIGAAALGLPEVTSSSAIVLALGMGIHNIPEGLAVSFSLRREKISRMKSFWYGQLSSIVFPIAAGIGTASVLWIQPLLPYALGFAAGAMIFVAIEEVLPESQRHNNTDLATLGALSGFLLMMILDLSLG